MKLEGAGAEGGGAVQGVSDILIKMIHRHPAIFLQNITLSAKL
jgi:hypothetical protein